MLRKLAAKAELPFYGGGVFASSPTSCILEKVIKRTHEKGRHSLNSVRSGKTAHVTRGGAGFVG